MPATTVARNETVAANPAVLPLPEVNGAVPPSLDDPSLYINRELS